YWWTALFIFLVVLLPLALYITGAVVLAGTQEAPFSDSNREAETMGIAMIATGIGLLIITWLALLVPGIALIWRRLHDANFSGALWCLTFIPYVGGLILFVFILMPPRPAGRHYDLVQGRGLGGVGSTP
ncbi:DUF805 domain-containing protein, partial [Leucobacter sp. wl10]|uniref:DUF805 domain-containing protein n=1 Tax=Leucobacter sp. wl10 TaxID=2304677 RepID=UPI000E9C66CD